MGYEPGPSVTVTGHDASPLAFVVAVQLSAPIVSVTGSPAIGVAPAVRSRCAESVTLWPVPPVVAPV